METVSEYWNKIQPQLLPKPGEEYRKSKLKRGFEMVTTTAVALPAGILTGMLGLAVQRDGGPAFYKSKRVKRLVDGEHEMIHVCKIRSMEDGADNLSAAEIAKINTTVGAIEDPRVTKIGKLLRRFNLDELPQIFQVMKGDFSLVGDRIKSTGAMRLIEEWRDELVMEAVNDQVQGKELLERAYMVQRWLQGYHAGLFSPGNVKRKEIKDDKKVIEMEEAYRDTQTVFTDIGVIAQTFAHMGKNAAFTLKEKYLGSDKNVHQELDQSVIY